MLPIYRFSAEAAAARSPPDCRRGTLKAVQQPEVNGKAWANLAWKILKHESPTGKASDHPEIKATPIRNMRSERKEYFWEDGVIATARSKRSPSR
jgi:hypothetical protein